MNSRQWRSRWDDFATAVREADARLSSRRCSEHHWQITGGRQLVNCWPNSKRGFICQVDGEKSRVGSLADAIRLAMPERGTPPWTVPVEVPVEAPVGLIRRFWRWMW